MGLFNLSHRVVLAPLMRRRSYGNIFLSLTPSYITLKEQHLLVFLFLKLVLCLKHQSAWYILDYDFMFFFGPMKLHQDLRSVYEAILIYLEYGPESKWKHGSLSLSWMRFIRKAVSSSARFGMVLNAETPISSTDKTLMSKNIYGGHFTPPRRLRTDEIPGIVNDFRVAARNAMDTSFDGVEIHGAHGYLIDQFLKDKVNDRSDEYGGSLDYPFLETTDTIV